jgi:hypothetical protein
MRVRQHRTFVTTPPSPPPSVLRHARRLSRRLWSIHVLRGLCLALGLAALALIVASQLTEPVLTRSGAAWVWGAVLLVAGVALVAGLLPLRRYRGARIADVLGQADPILAQHLRSALEFANEAGADQDSAQLRAAHLAGVQRALVDMPTRRVLPWSKLFHTSLLIGILGITAFAALGYRRPALRDFVRALIAPALTRSDGTRIADVVAKLKVQLSYPSYLGRDPSWLEDPSEISVPAGTTVELRVTPRLAAAERGRLRTSTSEISLMLADDGTLRGQLSASAQMRLHIEIESHGVRYEDPRAISLVVTPDIAPQVDIIEPKNGSLAPPGEAVSLLFVASDDVGVANVSLHARVGEGAETQRRIFSALDDGGPQRLLRSGFELVPDELGAREGDTLVLWLEATDTDLVNGPHQGRSQEITLEVAQPGQGLSDLIPNLQEIADTAVDVLAGRLERPVPKEANEARERFELLARATKTWFEQLDQALHHADQQRGSALDIDRLRGVRKRNEHLLTSEASLQPSAAHDYGERVEADARQVDELERDAILLVDMLARAHVDEAKAIADELRELKRHIEGLLDQVGKTHDPAAERELIRAIAKAQRRMSELARSLSRMATRVPSEFVNRDAMQQEAAESTLASLERAVQQHDLRSAAEHLDALAKQVDDLAAQLGEGGLRLQESRFGPRDRAMAEARQKLGILGAEQGRLAERSGAVANGAIERGRNGQDESRARALAPQADAIERAASELAARSGSGFQSGAANRAAERMRDARDALRAGDLAEARSTSESALQGLRETADDLESDAHMFPGSHGETAQRAQMARQAANDAERLSDAIDRAMPPIGDHLSDAERQKLQGDADAQRKAADAAAQLKQSFDKGPDGLPLAPGASESLGEAQQAMQRAERALQRGRPDEANREQQQASERLQKLAQSLAEQRRSGRRGGREGREEGSSGEGMRDAPVHIPSGDEWKGPTELRRKLLDAMHEAGPAGYEAAIQRYYQELMR